MCVVQSRVAVPLYVCYALMACLLSLFVPVSAFVTLCV